MPYLRKLGVDILRKASGIVFISEPYKHYVLEQYIPQDEADIFKMKTTVIPNGINKFWLENLNFKQKAEIKHNEIKILCVGDIDKNKNYLTTLNACIELNNRNYNTEFHVVGRVIDQKIFKSLQKFSGFYYHGTMHKEQLLQLYRKYDIFVMPSKAETFGLVYAEAISQGMPVIYTKDQGFDGQFKDGEVGFAVKYDNVPEIVQRIVYIYDNLAVFSKRCSEYANKFSWKRICLEYKKIYLEVKRNVI